MKIGLMVVTDGRQQCCEAMLTSLSETIGLDRFYYSVVVDDGCDPDYSDWLDQVYSWDRHLYPLSSRKRGFGGAIRAGWSEIPWDVEYVFHMEDDFVFNRRPDLRTMVSILEQNPEVAQVALKRQAWNEEERAAGGLVELHPDWYTQRDDFYTQRAFFTTNPSLYRRSLLNVGWPTGEHSEGVFSHTLLAHLEDVSFGFLGEMFDDPWVTHIGEQRTGVGY